MTIELGTFIGVAGAIAGMIFGYVGYLRGAKGEVEKETKTHTTLETKLDYISRGVDDIRIDIKSQETKLNNLTETVARVDESTKSAHKRIDKIENN